MNRSSTIFKIFYEHLSTNIFRELIPIIFYHTVESPSYLFSQSLWQHQLDELKYIHSIYRKNKWKNMNEMNEGVIMSTKIQRKYWSEDKSRLLYFISLYCSFGKQEIVNWLLDTFCTSEQILSYSHHSCLSIFQQIINSRNPILIRKIMNNPRFKHIQLLPEHFMTIGAGGWTAIQSVKDDLVISSPDHLFFSKYTYLIGAMISGDKNTVKKCIEEFFFTKDQLVQTISRKFPEIFHSQGESVDVVRYIFETYSISSNDFVRTSLFHIFSQISEQGNLQMIRYLLSWNQTLELPLVLNLILKGICIDGFFHVLKWISEHYEVEMDRMIREKNLEFVRIATSHGKSNIVKYLIRRYHISYAEFQFSEHLYLRQCFHMKCWKLVKWLINYYNLSLQDMKSFRNIMFKLIIDYDNVSFFQWLVQKFSISQKDFSKEEIQDFYTHSLMTKKMPSYLNSIFLI